MQLCECITVKQMDDYTNWIQLGMTLNDIGAPLELWEHMSKKSKKYNHPSVKQMD
ncbi:MAG: PriCT-2 domain-containing protein, partial [Candidatus Fonsibacter sp.]